MNTRLLPRPAARLLLVVATLGLFILTGCDSAFWSPDSKSLALDVHGKLRIFHVETKEFTSFNSGGRYVINPAWSPDGKTLAYYAASQRKESYFWNIWLRDLSTNKERLIPRHEKPFESQGIGMAILTIKTWWTLAWSPDGRRLATIALEKDRFSVHLINVADGSTVSLAKKDQDQRFPLWSPDGKKLAYMVDTNPDAVGHEISALDLYVADADGKNPRRLWNSSKQPQIWPFDPPKWAADSSGLVVLHMRPEDKNKYRQWSSAIPQQARFIPVSGAPSRVLTTLPTSIGMVAPDLKSVVYLAMKKPALVFRAAPFDKARFLESKEMSKESATPKKEEAPPTKKSASKESATAGPFSHSEFMPPYPTLSPDNKTVAWPVPNPKTKGFELRLYDVATGKKSIYPIP